MKILGLVAILWFSAPVRAGQLLFVNNNNGNTTVSGCTGAKYQTIGAALDAAQDGDEIHVCAGTYAEQVHVTKAVRMLGEPIQVFGQPDQRPIIAPQLLLVTLPTLVGGNPVAAAVLVDTPFFRLSDIDIDLSNNGLFACSPILAGVYLRNSALVMERVDISHAEVAGRPDCNSGVGLLVESGLVGVVQNQPIAGKARVIARDVQFESFQKAGLAALGKGTIVRVENGAATSAPTGATDAVAYGYELGLGATGRILTVRATGHATSAPGKFAAGLLGYNAGKLTFRRDLLQDNQVGVFVVGDGAHIKRSTFKNQLSDGIILVGDSNFVSAPQIDTASVDGCFILGEHNVIQGGYFTNLPVGIWIFGGITNAFYAVTWGNVPTKTQGVSGGMRDISEASVVPFQTGCATPLDCDDGDACTLDVCDVTSGSCSHVAATCDDLNPCTTDTCDATLGCQFTAVADGTPCGVGMTCTGGVCL